MFSKKIIIAFVLFVFAAFYPVTSPVAQDKTAPDTKQQIQLSFAPLVKKVAPAVVNIYAQRVVQERRLANPFFNDPFFERFFDVPSPFGGMSRKRIEQSLGSGVIVEDTGLVVTNAHVISESREITVLLQDGRQFEAEVVLEDNPTDIALIQITESAKDLPHVTLKPADSLEIGDLVLAIGNPFGVGQTVTSGIISALARSTLNINDFNFFIQTDAAINPGNSGGPLVAMDGGVVGINTAIFSKSGGNLGIGFAVPSEVVASVISAHKAGRFSESGIIRPWLGVTAQALTGEIAETLGLDTTRGALVTDIHSESPFAKAGLKTGDVILRVEDHDIRSPSELKFRMTMVPIGTNAKVRYYRDGKQHTTFVTTIEPPDNPPRNITSLNGSHPFDGAVVGNLNPALVTELGLKDLNATGVTVVKVNPRSRAVRLGLEPGVIIREVNGRTIENVDDLQSALKNSSGRSWNIILNQHGRVHRLMLR